MKLRPRAEVICFKGTKVLSNLTKGFVCFPGGGIDPTESAVDAAKREAREEADRVVINCTVAHPPTVQLWKDNFKDEAWRKGCSGGMTHWMTGSTSETPVHADKADRHDDYEPGFEWHPIAKVLEALHKESGGDWSDDVRVRIDVLTSHQKMFRPHKFASAEGIPTLGSPLVFPSA